MRRGQERYSLGQCTAKNADGSRCKFGASVLEAGGLRCRRHAEPSIYTETKAPRSQIARALGPDPSNRLICDGCGTTIYADTNMVMLRDELWLEVTGGKPKVSYCDDCIESKLGRPISLDDLKGSRVQWSGTIPCNSFWMMERNRKGRAPLK